MEKDSNHDVSHVVGLYHSFSVAHKTLNRTEAFTCSRMVEVGKALLMQKAKALVTNAANRPLLYSYGSDSTPMMTTKTIASNLDGHKPVVRRAGSGVDFLIEKAYLQTTTTAGQPLMSCILRDPVPLTQGKTAWCSFAALAKFMPMARTLGHTGLVINHYCFDRALQAPLSKRLDQRHRLYYQLAHDRQDSPDDIGLQELLDWCICTGCAAHDTHNGLKWGLQWLVKDVAGTLQNLHIAIESLRNAYDLLHAYLMPWLVSVLAFGPSSQDPQSAYKMWVALGVDSEDADILADLQVKWDGERLWVAEEHAGNKDLFQKISVCMLSVFKFKKFTDSRWITLGECCRSLVASVSLGMQGLVKHIRDRPQTSDYYIHGFARLDNDALRYAIVAALASNLCDSVLLSMLEDDRLARRVEHIDACMLEEVGWLENLEDIMWERLSNLLADCPSKVLKTQTILSSISSGAYVTWRTLSNLKTYPWRLCSGDVEANLAELEAMDEPPSNDPTTAKIHKLLQLGYNRSVLIEGIRLLGQVHWTTASVEQGHGSAATVHRMHKHYGSNMLSQRAFLHMFDQLVAKEDSKLTQNVLKTQRKMKTAVSKNINNITGRHVFLADCQAAVKVLASAADRGTMGATLMSKHAVVYQRLRPDEREVYEARARKMRDDRRDAQEEEVMECEREGSRLSRLSSSQNLDTDPQLTMSSCKFNELDVNTLAAMWNSPSFSKATVADLRTKATQAPQAPHPHVRAQLNQIIPDVGEPAEVLSGWARHVCKCRDIMGQCALVFETHGEETTYLFLYALQRPMLVGLLPLTKTELVLPALASLDSALLETLAGIHHNTYKMCMGQFVWDSNIVCGTYTNVSVIPHMFCSGDGVVYSDSSSVPLEDYLGEALLKDKVVKHKRSADNEHTDDQDLSYRFPFLKRYMAGDPLEPKGPDHNDPSHMETDEPVSDPLDDEEIDAVYAALQQRRQEWAVDYDQPAQHFKTCILGGAWSKVHRGVTLADVRAFAAGTEAVAWCKKYFGVQQSSYAYRKYGDEVASALALYWAHRMEHFYQIFLSARNDNYHYTSDDKDSAPDPELVIAALKHAGDKARSGQKRLNEIVALLPGSPGSSSSSR